MKREYTKIKPTPYTKMMAQVRALSNAGCDGESAWIWNVCFGSVWISKWLFVFCVESQIVDIGFNYPAICRSGLRFVGELSNL